MTHILSACRNFVNANNELKQKRLWKRENWYGIELFGKKIGVIGFGNIGSRVAVRCKAFEADIVAYDPYVPASKVTSLDMTYTKNLDDILACDIITIHTPKNKETIGMIGKNEIAKMKDGVILINVARGGLYDEAAVLEGLKSGKIAFFGVDVFASEPATSNPFLDEFATNVTPHLGANTKESQIKISVQAAHAAQDAIKGISYPNALNMPFEQGKISPNIVPYFELTQRLAFLASKLAIGAVHSLAVDIEGDDIKPYDASISTYAIVGALRSSIDDSVNYVNASFVAKQRGLEVAANISKLIDSPYKNRLTVSVATGNDRVSISGTIFDGKNPRITKINGFNVDVVPTGKMIVFKNSDVPGVIGDVGRILGEHRINIADFRLGRSGEGNAVAVIIVDNDVPKDVLEELKNLKEALDVRYAEI